MHNIEYLTERDLKYFEKKEALGEAIIIRIEPEMLLSLDLDELFRDRNKDQTLSVKELNEFLHAGRKKAARDGITEGSSEEASLSGIEKNLQHISLSPDQRLALMQLINSGASDEELMGMIGAGENTLDHWVAAADTGRPGGG